MNAPRPHAPACDRNQQVIFEVLDAHLPPQCRILELGSGTGQHAVYCAGLRPDWDWQCTDLAENLPGIAQWLSDAPQLPAALAWDLLAGAAPSTLTQRQYDTLFTANTLHIMPWQAVEQLFLQLPTVLAVGGIFAAYGPFNYDGQCTSDSNAQFDVWLKSRAAHQAIRDFEAVQKLADAQSLQLLRDYVMPANNRLLVWKRTT